MPRNELSELAKARQTRRDFTASASAFSALSRDAARLLAARSWDQPQFAWAISKEIAPRAAFETSWRPDMPSLFSRALDGGSLALARALARRLGLWREAQQARFKAGAREDPDWRSGRSKDDYESSVLRAIASSGPSDGRVWRARSWMLRELPHDPGMILSPGREHARQARHALTWGRPELALMLCEELASLDPEELASATLPGLDLPAEASDWNVESTDLSALRGSWRSNLSKIAKKSSESGYDGGLSECSLLPLLGLWESLLADAASRGAIPRDIEALGPRLGAARAQLWAQGACSSPKDYAELFEAHPFSAGDPRAEQLKNDRAASAHIAPLWTRAALDPRAPCGGALLWDRFCEAHAGVAGVDPNPFAILPGPACAAVWSLAAPGAPLVELGLERGFDPRPADALLVEEGASCGLTMDPKNALPSLKAKPLTDSWRDAFGTLGVWPAAGAPSPALKSRAAGGAGTNPPNKKTKATSKAPPKAGSEVIVGRRTLRRTGLTTLALICGHEDTASALLRAGCSEPDAGIAADEIASLGGVDKAGQLMARVDAFALSRIPHEEPAARPRRLLKA